MKGNISVKNISKRFGEKAVLDGFSAELPAGAVSCVMGESGCGKTTLLNLLLGIIKPDSGEICGIPDRVSAVFQEDRLCEGFSARTNVRIVAARGVSNADIDAALMALGLGDNLRTPVRELSGGMKRRVAICRALLAGGELIIMDEPFRGLDIATRERVAGYVREVLRGRTLLVVTHNSDDAVLLGAAQVIEMKTFRKEDI